MSAPPAASVLVPCFRSAAFLARALDSLLAQTFEGWEAVVVDNASDDGTFELALSYAQRDRRIHAHRNAENLGPLQNWRRAAALARGPFAALLFSDDWYAPELLAEALPYLGDPRIGFVQSAVRIVEDPARAEAAPVRFASRDIGADLRETGRALARALPDGRSSDRPVALAYPDDGSNLLFVNEQHQAKVERGNASHWTIPPCSVRGAGTGSCEMRHTKAISESSGRMRALLRCARRHPPRSRQRAGPDATDSGGGGVPPPRKNQPLEW